MSKKQTLLIVAGSVIILGVAAFFITKNNDSGIRSVLPGTQLTQPEDKLKPSSTIRVGQTTYIAPCNLLPQQQIESSFGKAFLPKNNSTTEDYFDESVPNPRYERTTYQSTCERSNYASNNPVKLITTVEQPIDTDDAYRQFVYDTPTQGLITADIAALKKQLATSASDQTKTFLAKLDTSLKTALESSDGQNKTVIDNLIFPVRIAGTDKLNGELAFQVTTKKGLVTLSGTFASEQRNITAIPPKELNERLEGMQKALAVVHANANKDKPIQSPAPAAYDRKTTKYGLTIMEPCVLLSPKVFASSNVTQNDNVTRTTFPAAYDFSIQKATNSSMPSNSCTRGFTARALPATYAPNAAESSYGAGGYLSLELEVRYAANPEQIQNVLKAYSAATKLTVDSGTAYRSGNTLLFTKDNYLFTLRGISQYDPNKTGRSLPGLRDQPISDPSLVTIANGVINAIPTAQ